jgi:hypothetical protein
VLGSGYRVMQRRFIQVLSSSVFPATGAAVSAVGLAHQLRSILVPSAWALLPDVVVPALGESISEGSISAVLKQAGDPVNADDPIAQVETDKVCCITFEHLLRLCTT